MNLFSCFIIINRLISSAGHVVLADWKPGTGTGKQKFKNLDFINVSVLFCFIYIWIVDIQGRDDLINVFKIKGNKLNIKFKMIYQSLFSVL